MRKIKFRAWDKEKGEFFKPTYKAHEGNLEYLQLSMDGRVRRVVLDEWDSLEVEDESLFENRYVIMQYTGLKDANGVEIYEGDIIRGPHDFGLGGFSVIAAPVKYHVIHGYQLHYFLLEQTEVIGNIYQNLKILGNNQWPH